MKIWKIVSGVLSIVLSFLVLMQSCAALLGEALDCEECPFFDPKTAGNETYYADGFAYIADPIKIYCKNMDICKRMERQIKGE